MRIINIFLFVSLIPSLLRAQEEVLALDTILQRIEQSNLQLQAYTYKAQAYQQSADAATGWMAPVVGAGTYMTPYPFQKLMDGRDKGSWMISAEQDIPNKKTQQSKKNYIASKGNAALASRAVTLNDLKYQAKLAYAVWFISEQRISVLMEDMDIMDMMKKIEEVRYPYNQALLGNIYKIDALIEKNKNQIEIEQGMIQRSRALLSGLMNQSGQEPFRIDTNYAPVFQLMIPDTSLLAEGRGDIHQMNEDIRSMQLGIESLQLERKPSYKVKFDHMSGFSGMMPHAFSVMGMISIPIVPWASKMYKSETRAMEYNIRAAQTEKSAMLQEVQGMLYGMQFEIQSLQKKTGRIESKILPAMQQSLDAYFLNYQENKLSINVVIEAWEDINRQKMELLDDKLKLFQMIADYEKEWYQ